MGSLTAEDSKKIITEYLAALRSEGPAALDEYLTEDANWWVAGNMPFSGDHTKGEMMEIVKMIVETFGSSLEVTQNGMIAEGNHVSAEMKATGLANGTKPYLNHFHYHFTLTDDGKISGIKEYMDTHEVHTLFFAA